MIRIKKEKKEKMEKNKIIAMGLVVGVGALIGNELGMFGDKDNGDIPQRIKQRAGGILGSQSGYGAAPGAPAPSIYNIPAAGEVSFPAPQTFDLSKLFMPIEPAEAQEKDVAKKAILGAHERVVSKGFDVSTTFAGTPSTPPFVQKDIYHKQMLSELGLSTPKKVITPAQLTPGQSAAHEVMSRVGGGYMGTGMTVSEYKSQFAERTYSTSPTGEVIKPKKTPGYVRRSEIGYTYVDGACVTKASVSSKKEIKTSGGNSSGGEK